MRGQGLKECDRVALTDLKSSVRDQWRMQFYRVSSWYQLWSKLAPMDFFDVGAKLAGGNPFFEEAFGGMPIR